MKKIWRDQGNELRRKIKKGMANPEVKSMLKKLNRRSRRPMSDLHKSKISDANAGKMPSNMRLHGNYPNINSGDYDINGKVMYFRSGWEANYALYLDWLVKQKQILRWEYEQEKFIFEKIKFETRSYLPDFKVYNNNGTDYFVEVKGYMDSKSKTKLKRMKKYYPKIKIELVDSKAYGILKKKIGKVCNFY